MLYLTHCDTAPAKGVIIHNSPKFAFNPNNGTNLSCGQCMYSRKGDATDSNTCRQVLVDICDVGVKWNLAMVKNPCSKLQQQGCVDD